jgi:glucose-1-phosphate adenylyltransferase
MFGEYIMDIPPQQRFGERWYTGTADAVFQNLYFVDREKAKFVIVLSGDHIYQMDYREMLSYHISVKADITVGAIVVPKSKASAFGVMHIDPDNKIIAFKEKPKDPPEIPDKPGYSLASMGIYVFNAEILKKLLVHDAEISTSSHDFGKDIIPYAISHSYPVYAYRFTDKDGKERYWQDVGTIDSFYEANMDLLSPIPKLNLYNKEWPIFTHARQFPPVKFASVRHNGEEISGNAKDSLIGDGSIVIGANVNHSVIFPNVRINEGSDISDSIIFNDCIIGKNVKIKNTIIDKFVNVPDNEVIGFDLEKDRKRFHISPPGIVVIPRGYRFKKR